MHKLPKDIRGLRLGHLVCVKPTPNKNKHGTVIWKCRCDCGRVVFRTYSNLSSKTRPRQSCPNCRVWPQRVLKDLTGKKFGLLTAEKATSDRSANHNVIWSCRCDCGNQVRRETSELLSKRRGKRGILKSCGCARRGIRSLKYKGVGDLSGTKWKNITESAIRRGHACTITKEYAWKLFLRQNKKCALTGVDLTMNPSYVERGLSTASLDRIDNNKGYIKGNVQWVHEKINFMKHSMPVSELIKWCILVADHIRGAV